MQEVPGVGARLVEIILFSSTSWETVILVQSWDRHTVNLCYHQRHHQRAAPSLDHELGSFLYSSLLSSQNTGGPCDFPHFTFSLELTR